MPNIGPLFAVLLLATFSTPSDATKYTLTTFAAAVKNAKDTTISVESITNDQPNIATKISIKGSNTVIQAATAGGVTFDSTFNISITITGNGNTISGFQFLGTIGNSLSDTFISVNANNTVLDNLNFNAVWAGHQIQIESGTTNNTVSNCNFEAKPTSALIRTAQLQILPHATIIGSHRVTGCTFRNMVGDGGDFGNEPLRLGLGDYSLGNLSAIIEKNVWYNTALADSEAISVKSQGNTIRYNTFLSQTSMVSFRNGDSNQAYGNFFFNAGGVRIKQANKISVFNNYFEGSALPIVIDDVSAYSTVPGTYQNYVTIEHNTFYNSAGSITLGTAALLNNNWANNLFYQPSTNTRSIFTSSETTTGTTFTKNFYSGVLGYTGVSGLSAAIFALEQNTDGYSNPTVGSSTNVTASAVSFSTAPDVTTDVTLRVRPTTTHTAGCSEPYSSTLLTGTINNRPLSLTTAGPTYKRTASTASSASSAKQASNHLSAQ